MPKHRQFQENWWWRHSAYEIRGQNIAPQAGAEWTQYDPWQCKGTSEVPPVTRALDDLLALFPFKSSFELTGAAVCEWARSHGPLGILPHQTLRACLPPRGLDGRDEASIARLAQQQSLRHEEMRARLVGKIPELSWEGAWRKRTHFVVAFESEAHLPSPGATVEPTSITEGFSRNSSIGEAWGRYFLEVPPDAWETHPYPEPETREFASAYSEPLHEWIDWACKLRDATAFFQTNRDSARYGEGRAVLSWFARAVAPYLRGDAQNRTRLVFRSPSLLASLALEAMQRVSSSRRPRLCKDPECSALFIPENARAEYHTAKCRWRHAKQLVRGGTTRKRRAAGSRGGKKAEA